MQATARTFTIIFKMLSFKRKEAENQNEFYAQKRNNIKLYLANELIVKSEVKILY